MSSPATHTLINDTLEKSEADKYVVDFVVLKVPQFFDKVGRPVISFLVPSNNTDVSVRELPIIRLGAKEQDPTWLPFNEIVRQQELLRLNNQLEILKKESDKSSDNSSLVEKKQALENEIENIQDVSSVELALVPLNSEFIKERKTFRVGKELIEFAIRSGLKKGNIVTEIDPIDPSKRTQVHPILIGFLAKTLGDARRPPKFNPDGTPSDQPDIDHSTLIVREKLMTKRIKEVLEIVDQPEINVWFLNDPDVNYTRANSFSGTAIRFAARVSPSVVRRPSKRTRVQKL